MSMSPCSPDESYVFGDGREVPLHMLFSIVAKYVLALELNTPFLLHDALSNMYTVTSVECHLNIADFVRGDGETMMRPVGLSVVTLIVTIDEENKKFTITDLYEKRRDMFDNLVKRICYQSPELVDRVLMGVDR